MIFGIGVDICKVSRFKNHFNDNSFLSRFFNQNEIKKFNDEQQFCEYYASRFSAKEAFSKALGTGIKGFSLKDLYVSNLDNGKPVLILEESLKNKFNHICSGGKISISLSHENEYAVSFVVIEQ